MPGNTLLVDCAERLLDVAVAALADPPARQYLTIGDDLATDDCRHLAVSLSQNGLGQSVNPTARGAAVPSLPTTKTAVRTARFTISLLSFDASCGYPTMNGEGTSPADPDAITAAATAVLTDQYDLWTALRDECSAGTLFDGVLDHGHGAAVEAPSTTIGPQGLTAGCRVEVSAVLLVLPDLGS